MSIVTALIVAVFPEFVSRMHVSRKAKKGNLIYSIAWIISVLALIFISLFYNKSFAGVITLIALSGLLGGASVVLISFCLSLVSIWLIDANIAQSLILFLALGAMLGVASYRFVKFFKGRAITHIILGLFAVLSQVLEFLYLKPQKFAFFANGITWDIITYSALTAIFSIALVYYKGKSNYKITEDKYNYLLEKYSGILIKLDRLGRVTYINRNAQLEFGVRPNDAIGKSAFLTIFKDGCDPLQNILDRIGNNFESDLQDQFITEINLSNGLKKWYSWKYKISENDDSDHIFEILLIGSDITELKLAEIANQSLKLKLKLLNEGLLDSYVRVDMNGTILDFNNAFLELTGYSADEIVKRTFHDLTPEKWHEYESDIIENQIKRYGYSDLYEKEYITKQGVVIPIELRSYLIKDANGNPEGCWAVVRDISSRKKAEEELRRISQQNYEASILFKSLINSIPDVIGLQNPDQTIQFYNEAGYKMLNLNPELVNGKKCYELIGRMIPCDICATKLTIASKQPESVEKFVPEMGLWIESRSYPVLDSGGDIKFIIEHIRDISARKQVEINLKRSEIQYRAIVDNSPLPMLFIEVNGNGDAILMNSNPAANNIFGIHSSTHHHRSILEVTECFNCSNLLNNISQTAATGNEVTIDEFSIDIKGAQTFFEVRLFQAELQKVVMVLTNITERIKNRQELELSEQKLRMIITENPMVFFMLNENGIFTLSEGLGLKKLGLKPGQVVGLSVFDVYKDFPDIIECSKKSLSGEPVKLALRVGDIYYDTFFTPVFDSNNRPKGVLGVAYDITSRVNAEQEVEKKSEELENYFNNSLDLLCIADLDGYFRKVNPEWSKLLGYSMTELTGKRFFDFIHPEDIESTIFAINDLSERGKVLNFTNRYLTTQGDYRWIEWRSFLDNNLVYAVARDITERKLAEEQIIENDRKLKEQNEEYIALNEELSESNQRIREINEKLIEATEKAQESDRLKSAFLANMSHEIRTPMNGIVGFCQLLKQTHTVDDQVAKYYDIISDSSNQLLAIINDIIDISKIEAGQVTLNHDPVSIVSVIERASMLFTPLANQKKIELKLNLDTSTSLVVLSDETKISQILSNLINNAIKFTKLGFVEVGVRESNKHISVWVKDTGIGIAKENQRLIFDRFRQVDGANPNSMKGTGLGLSISKSLVEMLGGEIWVDSDIGNGATFTFTIPNIKAMEDIERFNQEEDMPDKFDFGGVSILLAEDDNINKLLIRRALESANAKVLLANNGAEALKIVETNSAVKLVLMDIKMPVMDGLEATQLIKTKYPRIPIVAQTAYALPDERKRAIEAGCDAYLTKPINITMLYKTIQQLM